MNAFSIFSGELVRQLKLLNYPIQARTEKCSAAMWQHNSPAEDKAISAPKSANTTLPFELGRRVALVIGNSKYINAGRLANPANDVRAVAEKLRQLGFAEVIERYDLDLAAMNKELKRFGDKAIDADWATVYYAGHGIQMDGLSYLLPTDVVLERAAHVTDEAVQVERVLAKVGAAKKLKLVILDACRNNPFVARLARVGGTRALSRGLAPIDPTGGVLVAYATKDGNVAEDGNGSNSPFALALLKHIDEPGVEISLMFRRVRDTVLQQTKGSQEPYMYGSLPGESYYFKAPR